jgi:hypothetical protein
MEVFLLRDDGPIWGTGRTSEKSAGTVKKGINFGTVPTPSTGASELKKALGWNGFRAKPLLRRHIGTPLANSQGRINNAAQSKTVERP